MEVIILVTKRRIKMQIVNSEQATDLLHDEWARERLYNIDYTSGNKDRLALYHVNDLSLNELNKALRDKQLFLFDGNL
jgi:hypothetical protein